MVRHSTPCFVIADGGHARFVYLAADQALHTTMSIDAPHAHDRSRDLGSDKPGRSFESGSVTRHAIAPRHDLHAMEREKFARTIARKVCDDSAGQAFEALVLVAPPEILAEIQEHLDVITVAKVKGTLAKDLIKVPDADLYPHLKQWVRPTHRAV